MEALAAAYSSGVRTVFNSRYSVSHAAFVSSNASARPPQPTYRDNSTVGDYAGNGNIMAFPTTVLVDKDGNIVGEPFMGGIDDQSNYDQLMKQIQSVLDQK